MTDQVVAVETTSRPQNTNQSYVDWSAILAGAIIAAAISFVLLSFGAALGLTLSSAFSGTGASLTMYVVAIGLWLIWVQVSSVMAGAYIAGRLRQRMHDASQHEVEVRDGAHGLVVWALATVIGAWLTVGGVSSAVSSGANAVGSGIASIVSGTGVGGRVRNIDPRTLVQNTLDQSLDVLFRPAAVANGQAANGSPATAARIVSDQQRNEILRLLATGVVKGEISQENKAYIAQVVSRETGVSQSDAATRVDTFLKARNEVVAKAAEIAENSRKVGIILAFVTAVSLLLAAAGGWWAAIMGGGHRDEETLIPLLVWRR
ncbi:MAG: hypothetical protein AB7F96_07945 [Beijerinckiaceae bacterium]